MNRRALRGIWCVLALRSRTVFARRPDPPPVDGLRRVPPRAIAPPASPRLSADVTRDPNDASLRRLQPALGTSTRWPFDSRARARLTPLHVTVVRPRLVTAAARLAACSPRVPARLTSRARASAFPRRVLHRPASWVEKGGPHRSGTRSTAAFSTARRSEGAASDAHRPAGASPATEVTSSHRRRGPHPPRSRQRARAPRSGAPSIDRCPSPRGRGTRHHCPWFCHRRAGFRRSFAPRRSRGES